MRRLGDHLEKNQPGMEEPSVLDYIKSRLLPWKYPRVELPPEDQSFLDYSGRSTDDASVAQLVYSGACTGSFAESRATKKPGAMGQLFSVAPGADRPI